MSSELVSLNSWICLPARSHAQWLGFYLGCEPLAGILSRNLPSHKHPCFAVQKDVREVTITPKEFQVFFRIIENAGTMSSPPATTPKQKKREFITLRSFDDGSVMGYRICDDDSTDEDERGMSYFETRRRSRSTILVRDESAKTKTLAGNVDFHLLNHLWKSCLAVAGLFDILAYVLPDFVESQIRSCAADAGTSDCAAVETTADATMNHGDPFAAAAADGSFPLSFLEFVRRLDERGHGIFLFFSFLWFLDAFFAAHSRRRKALVAEERRLLFGGMREEDDGARRRRRGKVPSSVARYCSLVLPFLWLPVGFYFAFYHVAKRLCCGEEIEGADQIAEKLVVAVTDRDDNVLGYEEFSAETKLSVIGAIVQYYFRSILQAANTNMAFFKKSAKSKAIKKLLGKAIRNPLRFRKKLREFLTRLRWIKYLAPLVGVGNKLLGNTMDIWKKWKLQQHAKRVKRAHQLIWGGKEREKISQDSAAIVIQTTFRAYWARKVKRALILLRGDNLIVCRVQRKFRRKLKVARERIAAKRHELERLEMMKRQNSKTMSNVDKRTMYELQDELGKEAKELLDRKLLLRPNTKFAVYWKIFFIVAVLWEMAQKAATPLLRGMKNKKADVPLTMSEFVAKTLVPTRASDLPACREARKDAGRRNRDDLPWFCREPIAQWQGGFRDAVALAITPAPVSEWPECREERRSKVDRLLRRHRERRRPWYCLDSVPARHAFYRMMVDLTLERFHYFLGTVMVLDVFVTFFTGRFNSTTGELIPKPWFLRWIAPGLTLQLIVNPNLADISNGVYRCLRIMAKMGPYRTYRHVVAVIFPFTYGAAYLFLEYIWFPMVQYENAAGAVDSPFLEYTQGAYY